ncbi:pyridoxal-phosphate dependent enzyme [Ilyomonas limi]|uniref:Pyridoxal-phosphate dependent enzyme n=1 Tax=Ilyomonas limi TaxID=2575867 RepID=A0A4U3KWT5_9BACT|nr:pyridoxal-phosphate dependent enzyme [Ilyomonas limi]TKK65517.1 pyridoxal-phosphate dependent enzyme [Ilyomonas limi]
MLLMNDKAVRVHSLHAPWLKEYEVQLDVLRLDEVHPVVSGNKWYKLHFYLQEAIAQNFDTIATFGGAYSNHIAAAAYVCKAAGLQSIGIIRGEEPAIYSHTLQQAKAYGMQLHFVSREKYKQKEALQYLYPTAYWINEGGSGEKGVAGAALILQQVPHVEKYTHVTCAVGTGTTLAGIISSALPHHIIIGISVLKGDFSLEAEIKNLLPSSANHQRFSIAHDYHFGGYAKYNAALLEYMNKVWKVHQLPTDFVYTAKALYGTEMMVRQKIIPQNSRVLMVHTGGLQGNLSLPAGTLTF